MSAHRMSRKQLVYTQLVVDGMSEKEAAIEAGYDKDTINQQVAKLRGNERIQEKIDFLRKEKLLENIARVEERRAFWTNVMRDPKNAINARLKASELLGKSDGDFIDKKEINTKTELPSVLVMPEVTPEQWEQYWEDNNG